MDNTKELVEVTVKANVYEKLAMARVKLQSLNLKKSGQNPRFKYFELADFLPQLNKIFLEMRLCSSLKIQEDIATLKIFNSETNPEDCVEFSCPFDIPEAKLNKDGKAIVDKMQCVGAGITYVRRYLYMMALEIVEADLLDATCYDKGEEEINSISNVQELNKIFEKLGKREMQPQLKQLLWNRAKKIGSCFSRESNCFVPA